MKKKTARKKPAVKAPPRDIDRLLACVEMMVVALEKHFGNHPKDLDEKRLERIQVAMTACHNVLARTKATGEPSPRWSIKHASGANVCMTCPSNPRSLMP